MGESHALEYGEYSWPTKTYRLKVSGRHDTHYVRGVYFHDATKWLIRAGEKMDVALVPEPRNPHDSWAVGLYSNRRRYGYLARDTAFLYHDYVRAMNESGLEVIATA